MPTTTCPHCNRVIQFEMNEMHTVFACGQCGGKFTPLGGPVLEETGELESAGQTDYDEYTPRQSNTIRSLIIALIAAGVVIFVILGIVVVSSSGPNDTQKQAAQNKAKPASETPPPSKSTSQADTGGFLSLFTGFLCLALILGTAYLVGVILLMAWVARDCRARGVDGGAVWVFTILFVHWIGLIIYLASRPHGILVPCMRCGNKKLMAALICPHCGVKTKA